MRLRPYTSAVLTDGGRNRWRLRLVWESRLRSGGRNERGSARAIGPID